MAIEVFNRYEKKYMLDKECFEKLVSRLSDRMELDKYNKDGKVYRINNIYYDTEDDRLIRASIEKPVYKEKLRLRAYGDATSDTKAFVEIKKKYNGIVNKRRTGMKLSDAYSFLNDNIVPNTEGNDINTQVLKELEYFTSFYKVVPKLYLSYERYAYFEKGDGDFRVTFDTNIITRRYDLNLESGCYGEKLLPDDKYLMEIKINGAVPLWFLKIISEFNIYPVSFSKYGTEYKRYLERQTGTRNRDVELKEMANDMNNIRISIA